MELTNGKLRVLLVPEIGGSIIECSVNRGEQWISIMRQAEEPLTRSSNASSFVLIPYSNRLRDGRFMFDGTDYQLQGVENHAIHGDVRDRPLQVLEHTNERIVLGFQSHEFEGINFPFPFSAKMIYSLEGLTFSSRIELSNTGSKAMPAGCGFHPYFNRRVPGSTGEVELQLTVGGVYPGGTPLPTGPAIPIQPDQNFKVQRPLDVELDHCFSGWNRQAVIDWPGSGIRANIQAEPGMEHVILYSPNGEKFFALEPVTNANDGFNLFAQGDTSCGVVVLQPGETLKTGFEIRLQISDRH